ncbi:MAG: putative quinol monooxygenase [Pseudomonadales bacterium]
MKIIISGTVDLDPEQMDAAMVAAKPLIEGALTQDGILDYDWCPDPLTPGRLRVFERWESEAALQNHFNNHWYNDMRMALAQFGIRGADVLKYRIELAEPVYDETGTARADFFTETSA